MLKVGDIVASNVAELVVLLAHHGIINSDEPYVLVIGRVLIYNECTNVTFVYVEEV